MPVKLSIVISTLDGREESLKRSLSAIADTTREIDTEVLIVRNRNACGAGWDDGATAASGDYIALSCDDVLWLPGWWQAAASVCDMAELPAPLILNEDGSVLSCGAAVETMLEDGSETDFTRAPFVSRRQYELIAPLLRTHYFCDNFVSFRGRQAGFKTVVSLAYRGVSIDEQFGKTNVSERLYHDRLRYEQVTQELS